MKKIFVIVAAFAAMTFTGCGNSQKQGASDADSTNVEVSAEAVDNEEVNNAIEDMTAQLDAKDASKFNEALAKTQAKIQELVETNPEAAKTYLQKLQEYLKANAEQIKTIAGDNVAAAASAIVNVPAAELVETLKSQVGTAKEQGNDVVSNAAKTIEAVKNAPEEAKKSCRQSNRGEQSQSRRESCRESGRKQEEGQRGNRQEGG